jgi:hypothetical protein
MYIIQLTVQLSHDISNKHLLEERDKQQNVAVTVLLLPPPPLPVQKQTTKRHACSIQYRDAGRAKEIQKLGQQ